MENVLLFTTKKKSFNKVITVFITFALCLVLAFAPLAFPVGVAYAFEAPKTALGSVVGMIASSVAFSAVMQAAGITVTSVILAGTAQAFIALLLAMGIGFLVGTLAELITDYVFFGSFRSDFWRLLSTCWDNAKNKFKCTAATFVVLANRVKQVFGIEQEPERFIQFPHHTFNSINEWSMDCSNLKEAPYGWTCSGSSCPNSPLGFDVQNKKNRNSSVSIRYSNANLFTITITDVNKKTITINAKGHGDDPGYCMFYPFVCDDALYLPTGSSYLHYLDHSKYFGINASLKGFRASNQFINDNPLTFKNNMCTTIIDDTTKYFAVVLPDSSVVYSFSSLNQILYYLIIKNASLVYSSYSFGGVSSIEHINDDVVSLGNISGSIPTGTDVINYREYSKDATYDKSKDLVRGITDSVDEADAESITGDIVIGLSDTANPALVDVDGNVISGTSIQDIASVTDVSTDAALEDTQISVEPYVSWITGVNLVKNASAGITEKFPFCIPSYLKNQLNLLVADDKEPIFKIPFKIESVDLSSDIVIDLTKFEKVTKITDFFIILILAVGLSFATKKMFF